MANYRGKGGTTQRNIIGVARETKGKNGPCMAIEAQFSVEDPRTQAVKDTNPYLETHEYTPQAGPNAGQTMVSHRRIYSMAQWDAIKNAAQMGPTLDKGGETFALKADVFQSADKSTGKKGLVINTKGPMGPSDYGIDESKLKLQADTVKQWKAERAEREAAKAAEKEAGAEAPAPEASAEAAAPEAETEVEFE